MSEEESKKIFSSKLKFYMALRGVKQSDIVRDLQLNSSTVSNWYNGIMVPRMDKLKALANYLSVSIGDLIQDNTVEIEQERKELDYLNTISTHLQGITLSNEDLKEIENFIEYIKNRNTKN